VRQPFELEPPQLVEPVDAPVGIRTLTHRFTD
jgi:hypothetical protein